MTALELAQKKLEHLETINQMQGREIAEIKGILFPDRKVKKVKAHVEAARKRYNERKLKTHTMKPTTRIRIETAAVGIVLLSITLFIIF